MKFFQIALTLGLLATTAILVFSQEIEEYDYEDDAAAAPPPSPQPSPRGRTPLLAVRPNKASPLLSNANKINKQSGAVGKASPAAKAVPAPAAQEEPEEELADYDEGLEEPVEQTSTEAPKKTIKPIVRPFRSNDDLLAALKRRRQQVQNSGAVVDKTTTTTSTTSAPNSNKKPSNSFGSNGRRNRNGGNRVAPALPQEEYLAEVEPSKKAPQSRKYNSRNSARSAPPSVLEDIPVEEQPKPKFGRGSRRPAS